MNQTQSVGQKNPNKFGLYDMSGNVWVWDPWSKDKQSGATLPILRESERRHTRRGGGWSDIAQSCQLINPVRVGVRVNSSYPYLGFRIVRSPPKDKQKDSH